MTIDILDRLFSGKKGPCLSIIIPLHKISRERMLNAELFRKSVRKGKSLLKRKEIDAGIAETMLTKLDLLASEFNPDMALNGIGLFIVLAIMASISLLRYALKAPAPADERVPATKSATRGIAKDSIEMLGPAATSSAAIATKSSNETIFSFEIRM